MSLEILIVRFIVITVNDSEIFGNHSFGHGFVNNNNNNNNNKNELLKIHNDDDLFSKT